MALRILGEAKEDFLLIIKRAAVELPNLVNVGRAGALLARFIGKLPRPLDEFGVGVGCAGGKNEEEQRSEGEEEKRGGGTEGAGIFIGGGSWTDGENTHKAGFSFTGNSLIWGL